MKQLPSHRPVFPLYPMQLAWKGHFPFAYDLVFALRPSLIVELGVHTGESFFSFCQALKHEDLPGLCVGIDLFQGDAFTGSYDEGTFQNFEKYRQQNYSTNSAILRKSFAEASLEFAPESIELLHIDGAHDLESVKNDFQTWLPKMKPGGVILFHDIAVTQAPFGVYKMWQELREQYQTFEFHHSFGLGVLQVPGGPDKSDFLQQFFQADAIQAESIRQYYIGHMQTAKATANAPANAPAWTKDLGLRDGNFEFFKNLNEKIDLSIYKAEPHLVLDVILQTHCNGNSQAGKKRYSDSAKKEVSLRCLQSLVNSLNACGPHIDLRLVLMDDHSDVESVQQMKKILQGLKKSLLWIDLPERGIMKSIEACYRFGLEQSRGGLVYFAQDDYLHFSSAIEEMVDSYLRFKTMLGTQEVGIFPFDDPYRYYAPQNVEATRLVFGKKRHWRRNYFTSSVFLTSVEVIKQNADLMMKMATSPVGPTMEDESINLIWQERGVVLFSPIPSLALHLQYETEKDPYIQWQRLWDENAY